MQGKVTTVGELYRVFFANEIAGIVEDQRAPYDSPCMMEKGYLLGKGIGDDHKAVYYDANEKATNEDEPELSGRLARHYEEHALVVICGEEDTKAFLNGDPVMFVTHDRRTTFMDPALLTK